MRRKWFVTAGLAMAFLVFVLIFLRLSSSVQDVQVIYPSQRKVVELVIASGRLRTKQISDIGSEVTGTVQNVFADEGDNVSSGQLLITLERADVQQQLEQAQLAVRTAQRQLELVRRGPLPEEVARARAQLNQARRVGEARVTSARQRLKGLQEGRPEERRRAEAQLSEARARLVEAEANLQRSRRLVAQGAISQQDLDRAIATEGQARAAVRAAQQAVELAKRPASAQVIAAAQADLQAAQADYQESTRIAQENLSLVLRGARVEDVRLAEARLAEARAAVVLAREQLGKRVIKSPISGVVTQRDVEPGESVTPGNTLLRITNLQNSEIFVETDEINLPKLNVGQTAIIIPPSFPNQPFRAKVKQIGPEVDTDRGVVAVRLRPLSLPEYARPDLTVDANIEVANLPSVLSVPASSLLEQGNESYVLVYENGRALRNDVRVLARGSRWVGVDGVSESDRVIVNAVEVTPGQRVRITDRR